MQGSAASQHRGGGGTRGAAGTGAVAVATAAAAAAVAGSSAFVLPSSSRRLLYIEEHHRDPLAALFCCLCRCTLARDGPTLDAHLQGRKHTDKVRAVQKIRTTITIKDSGGGGGGGSGGSGQQQQQPPQSRRIQLGLIPTLNLPCFWKAVLQAVRIEQHTQAQQQAQQMEGGGGSSSMLAELQLEGPCVLPHHMKLKYTDGERDSARMCGEDTSQHRETP